MFCNKLKLITVYFFLNVYIVHCSVITTRHKFNCGDLFWKKCFTNDDNRTKTHLVLDDIKREGTFDDILLRLKRSVSNTFKKPTIDNNLHMIQDEIKTIKSEIDHLKLTVNGTDNAKQISTLESSMETLRKLLDDHYKYFVQKEKQYEKNFNALAAEIDIIKNNTVDAQENALVNECVDAIKKKQFNVCEDKLDNIRQYKIQFIVKEVYNKQIRNCKLLTNFSISLQNIQRSVLVFQSLYDEMKNDNKTIVHLAHMAKINNNKVLGNKTKPLEYYSTDLQQLVYLKTALNKTLSRRQFNDTKSKKILINIMTEVDGNIMVLVIPIAIGALLKSIFLIKTLY